MFSSIIEIIKSGLSRLLDYYMYICYWHPLNHRMWFEIYRNRPMRFKFDFGLNEPFKYIDEHGGHKLAKIDYVVGYFRNFSICTLLIILGVISTIYMAEHHLGVFKGM